MRKVEYAYETYFISLQKKSKGGEEWRAAAKATTNTQTLSSHYPPGKAILLR